MYRPTHHIRTALESVNNSTSLKHHLEKMRRGIEKRFHLDDFIWKFRKYRSFLKFKFLEHLHILH